MLHEMENMQVLQNYYLQYAYSTTAHNIKLPLKIFS